LFVDYFLPAVAFLMQGLEFKTVLPNPAMYDAPFDADATAVRRSAASVLHLPVVYQCPRELGLPDGDPHDAPRYYIEPSIDLNRAQPPFDWSRLDGGRPLLLCSFGSQSRVVLKAKQVLQVVIDAMAARPDWQAVVSLGASWSAEEFTAVPANVVLAGMVPQLDLLQKAAIMVTHGGLNSLKECVFFGVPMIVIPIDLDQPSNALRIVQHGLGLMAEPDTVSPDALLSLIDRIQQDEAFKRRSVAMQQRFREIETSGIGVETVMTLLR
jgi:zeaxanthin glucosyltransferase